MASSRCAGHADDPPPPPAEWLSTDWEGLTRLYRIIGGITLIPFMALSVYLHDPLIILDWVRFMIGLPILLCMMTFLFGILAWPVLLIVAAVIGRYEKPKNLRRDGPGVIV